MFWWAGALESDYPVEEEILKAESYPQYKPPPPATDSVLTPDSVITTDSMASSVTDNSGIGGISFVQCATGSASPSSSPVGSPPKGLFHVSLFKIFFIDVSCR